MNVHTELVKQASPFITMYRDDLIKHDKTEIESYPGRSFLHFTGDTGTVMITLYQKEDYPEKFEVVPYLFGHADRWHILKQKKDLIKHLPTCNKMDLILYYNGKTLKAIQYQNAVDIIGDYNRSMEWKFKQD